MAYKSNTLSSSSSIDVAIKATMMFGAQDNRPLVSWGIGDTQLP